MIYRQPASRMKERDLDNRSCGVDEMEERKREVRRNGEGG